jgi:hypothetical protein
MKKQQLSRDEHTIGDQTRRIFEEEKTINQFFFS